MYVTKIISMIFSLLDSSIYCFQAFTFLFKLFEAIFQ